MSDIAHRHVTRGAECVCGSDWNWIADACNAVVPFVPPRVTHDDIYPNDEYEPEGYFECRKGHAFCGRH
jgi:hypothetical protein